MPKCRGERRIIRRQGRQVEHVEIEGDGGHLDGLLAIGKVGGAIRKSLGP